MPWRIPEADLDQVKRQTDLLALVRSRGIELAKHGTKDFIGRCPFHDDKNKPNFIVSPAKGLWQRDAGQRSEPRLKGLSRLRIRSRGSFDPDIPDKIRGRASRQPHFGASARTEDPDRRFDGGCSVGEERRGGRARGNGDQGQSEGRSGLAECRRLFRLADDAEGSPRADRRRPRAPIEYHSADVGHGMPIGELQDRVRRREPHLDLPPLAAH